MINRIDLFRALALYGYIQRDRPPEEAAELANRAVRHLVKNDDPRTQAGQEDGEVLVRIFYSAPDGLPRTKIDKWERRDCLDTRVVAGPAGSLHLRFVGIDPSGIFNYEEST